MRQATQNEYEKAVNKVVDYINLHLSESPDLKTLSEIANISEFHFHRIFKAIIGESIGEYIVRLRLEHVAQILRMTNANLNEIAVRVGYGTKFALSKAFKKQFGIAPSAYRRQPNDISFFERGEKQRKTSLHPAIRNVEAKKIVYIRIIDWYGSPHSYVQAWRKLRKFAKENNLIDNDTEYIGLSFDDPTITKPENCRFYACMTIQQDIIASGAFGIQTIEGGLYAVFVLNGAYSGLLDLYFNIYINWLPSSGYKLRKTCAFEKYLNSLPVVAEEELLTEIYVPVSKIEI